LAALKAKPKITFASAGIGTPGHFAGELLKLKFDENLTHVPYKGAGPALNDLIGGHVEFYFSGFPAAVPHVRAGSLKLLALSSAKRSPAAPDVPNRHQGLRFHAVGRLFRAPGHAAAGDRPPE
jgi:tripartite-type tricarboxylate transporter receptor subunit TctC